MSLPLDPRCEHEHAPAALERIPTPFVRISSRPARLRVGLVGEATSGSNTLRTLHASGHRVASFASAAALVDQLPLQLWPFDVIVVDCGAKRGAALPALELLRAHLGATAVVLLSVVDSSVLAAAQRLSLEQVLEGPVHPGALLVALLAVELPRPDELGVYGDTWRL